MAAPFNPTKRNAIPRWRTFRATAELGELNSLKERTSVVGAPEHFEQLDAWREHPTVWHAADLLAAAIARGDSTAATTAAGFLVERERDVNPLALGLAREVLGDQVSNGNAITIKELRGHVRAQHRNPMAWMDIALLQAIGGNKHAALRAATVALQLAPDNRFILRSAVRAFLHFHEPDRAQRALRRSSAVRVDPWLLSAEIAVASAVGEASKLLKQGRTAVGNRMFSPRQISELASAIATMELKSGSSLAARRLFRTALIDPTENSAAQVHFMDRKLVDGRPQASLAEIPRLFELPAMHAVAQADWPTALEQGKAWFEDQPFSSRPAQLVAVAAGILGTPALAVDYLQRALKASPHDVSLIGHLAYIYALLNKLDEAEELLSRLPDPAVTDNVNVKVPLLATLGLVEFRRNRQDVGRTLYLAAIAQAEGASQFTTANLARINLAREELLARSKFAGPTLRAATEANKRYPSVQNIGWLERVIADTQVVLV